jgi:prepilin-type N-terminal cleavage/methylation domain-containing protein
MSVNARGFTLIELLIVVAVISIVSSIAVPGLLRARVAGNEASAIGSVRVVVSAQADYFALNGAYAASLNALAATCPAVSTPFISADLDANGVWKNGYIFDVVPGAGAVPAGNDTCGTPASNGFYVTARPVTPKMTGGRAFAADAEFAIWQNENSTPPPQPFSAGGTISPLGR